MTTITRKEKFRKLHKQILDNAPLSIITIDKNGYITSANNYYKAFSKTKDYRHHNIFKGEFFTRENLVEDYRKLLTDGTIVRREECFEKNSKGSEKYLKIVAVPLRDKKGNITGALSMAEDSTDAVLFKKKLEDLNKQLESKVSQRTTKLKETNDELDKALKLKSIFLADASHELRTALTIIQGNLELITHSQVIKKDDLELYDQISNEIKKMSTMLSDLMMMSSSNLSDQKLNYEKIDLNHLISGIVKSTKVLNKEKNITVKHINDKLDIEIMADKNKMEKLLLNLIRNAIRYNKINGWVNIEAEKRRNEIIIKVADGGIGIPEEHQSAIFERFYRVDKVRSRSEGGSGLGLAICKWVAEAHGASIVVSSRVGEGSVFTVCLPSLGEKL